MLVEHCSVILKRLFCEQNLIIEFGIVYDACQPVFYSNLGSFKITENWRACGFKLLFIGKERG
jgi:hypothetical protein